MTIARVICVSTIASLLAGGGLAWAAPQKPSPTTLPSQRELHEMFDRGEYVPLLAAITAVLEAKGSYDRYDVFTLRGEAILRARHDTTAAAGAFREASRVAEAANAKVRAATARATEYLMKRSRANGYLPKPAPGVRTAPPTIDVIDPASRMRAFAAMLDDEIAARSRDIEISATANASIDGLIKLVPSLAIVADVERTVAAAARPAPPTDEKPPAEELPATPRTGQLADAIAEHVINKAYPEASRMNERVNRLEADAARLIQVVSHYTDSEIVYKMVPAGLNSYGERDLADIIQTCKKILSTCEQLAPQLQADGGKGDFARLTGGTKGVHDQATAVLQKYGTKKTTR